MKASSTASPEAFHPHGLLRHPHVQSILATKSARRGRWLRRDPRLEAPARLPPLDAGDGVRLCGYHSAQPARRPLGLVVLIHAMGRQPRSALSLLDGVHAVRSRL